MTLRALLDKAEIQPLRVMGDTQMQVQSLASDSRQVAVGGLFVAIPGTTQNGGMYVDAAVQKGAAVVVREADAEGGWTHAATLVEVADVRRAVAKIAAAFYAPQPQHLFAITGTDGKTSTADFVRQIAGLMGQSAASIGTLGLRSPSRDLNAAFPAHNTSPEPILLHRTLQQLAQCGVTVAAIEASSHGLDQKRVDGVHFTAAAFTNLTRDHLDYHGALESYAAAKARLFSEVLAPSTTAVLNRDDAQFTPLAAICAARNIRVISFGTHRQADYRIASVTPHEDGLDAVLQIYGEEYAISLPIYGAFQLQNMLAAMGLLSATGAAVKQMVALLPKLVGVPGRLEKVAVASSGAPIFVDYAHTPAALENILKTLRAHTQRRLHVVFGCGGDRDAGKRPEMGRVAAQYADVITVTDDNPRSENPATIRADIMQAAPGATEVPDRAQAIQSAIQKLAHGDVLVVAGKGHETYQIIGNQTLHFSDAEAIQNSVRAA